MEAVRAAAKRNIPLTIVTSSLDIAQLCAGKCPRLLNRTFNDFFSSP